MPNELTGVAIGTGAHPLAGLENEIWGVNIVRTNEDFGNAPPSIFEAFEVARQMPRWSLRCGCCSETMKKPAGMAVLRLRTGGNIPVPICRECLKDESTSLTRRIVKTLTGVDCGPSTDWKDVPKQ